MEHESEEKKCVILKRMADLRVRLETASQGAFENIWNLTAEYFTANVIETGLHSEDEKIVFDNVMTRMENLKTLSEKKKSLEQKMNQCQCRKSVLRSSLVSEKVRRASKPSWKIAAKEIVDGPSLKIREKPILTINLTCEDVEEYFPDVLKVNLGVRCDSSEFRKSNKCVPCTERNEVPVKESIRGVEGVSGFRKEHGSNHKPALYQPRSAARKSVYSNCSNFKMIRVDYKKDVGKKPSVNDKPSQ